MAAQSTKKTRRFPWIILLIVLVVGWIVFGRVIKFALVLLLEGKSVATRTLDTGTVAETGNQDGGGDAKLIGNWDTGCLIPDRRSNWAERHTFRLETNGAANHKRYAGASCAAMEVDHDDQMTWEIVGGGQINLYYSTGGKIYDIYEINGDALKFGHGFCNCTYAGGAYGFSEGERFVRLNDFLLYKRQL